MLKPLGERSTIFTLTGYCMSIDLIKVQESIFGFESRYAIMLKFYQLAVVSFAVNGTKFGDPSFNNYRVMEIAFVQMNLQST